MKSEQLSDARNPLLPSAMAAMQRAAQRARNVAKQTHTAIVVMRGGKVERITPYNVQEPPENYDTGN